MMITTEMLFEHNVGQIVQSIETEYNILIQSDFDTNPDKFLDFITWLELHPKIVGEAFMKHIINYGITNDDIS